jgi:hypothetical protein
MKTLINYFVRDAEEHKHESGILGFKCPTYAFSPEPPGFELMKWTERRQKELHAGQKIIVMGIFKF